MHATENPTNQGDFCRLASEPIQTSEPVEVDIEVLAVVPVDMMSCITMCCDETTAPVIRRLLLSAAHSLQITFP